MTKKLTFSYSADSHVGIVRKENQDSFGKFPADTTDLSHPKGHLFVVADGMGGHRGGQKASQMAVDILQESYFSHPSADIAASLQHAFDTANARIYDLAQTDTMLSGMGTTCTALVLHQDRMVITHVGDSRAYRIRRHTIEQLTTDHSQVAEMERQGIITKEQAKAHPYRSVITRALGVTPEVEPDILTGDPLGPGDRFLLCSDGLAGVENHEIEQIVNSSSTNKACQKLIKRANERGGADNVTVLIIKVTRKSTFSGTFHAFFGER
ncbi:MAG: Stp1/IreP family PP2C-type Ser/Thr phosphatase [bacterium]